MSICILSIEDDPHVSRALAGHFAAAPEGFALHCAATLDAGLRILESVRVDCVVTDYMLPDGDGLGVLRSIRTTRPGVPVILLTGAGSERVAVDAMKLGADDYVVKHGDFLDAVVQAVRGALGRRAMSSAVSPTGVAKEARVPQPIAGFIGSTPIFRDLLRAIDCAAGCSASVLLEGESGTGKDMVARAIHEHSARAAAPFVVLNCAAIPEALLESELFGHIRGAFTGAERDRRGFFEEADGGTLFLDEIGEMAIGVQAKLLRALQDGAIRPIGSTRHRATDVRIVAASNRDLAVAVARGHFRLDLYHRLRVLPIRVPSLRDRRNDVVVLAEHFLRRFGESERRPGLALSREAADLLAAYDWPGNVRQLQNEMHRLVVTIPRGGAIACEDLSDEIRRASRLETRADRPLREIVRQVETAAITDRLRSFGYHRTATARSLGLTREGLWNKLRLLGLAIPRDDER